MTVRVFLAASIFISSSFKRAGGVISRSFPSSHLVFTPMLFRTSMIRFTSSIRATLRNVVLPLLSKLAHSSPTAAFLLVLISISPDNSCPPCTLKFILLALLIVTILRLSTSEIRAIISRLRFCLPLSIRFTALWLVPSADANCACVMFLDCRCKEIRLPIFCKYVSLFIRSLYHR